jgi:hypothetical protein
LFGHEEANGECACHHRQSGESRNKSKKMLALYYFNWSSENVQASCGGERQAGAQNTSFSSHVFKSPENKVFMEEYDIV